MLKAIIIDDELRARETIENILLNYCEDIEIIDQAHDVASAVLAIKKQKPDIIFLDINMPDGTGFDVLRKLDKVDFRVIFITAYQEHAIQAIKFNAFDYILKPIDPEELINAVKTVSETIEKDLDTDDLEMILTNIQEFQNKAKRIVLRTSENIHFVDIRDIIRCESDRNYTMFYIDGQKRILVSKTLKEYEEILSNYGFFRSHQSHLININYLDSFERADGGNVVMKDGSKVPVSSRKKEQLLKIFEQTL